MYFSFKASRVRLIFLLTFRPCVRSMTLQHCVMPSATPLFIFITRYTTITTITSNTTTIITNTTTITTTATIRLLLPLDRHAEENTRVSTFLQ